MKQCDFCENSSVINHYGFHLCAEHKNNPETLAQIEKESEEDANIAKQDEQYYEMAYGGRED